MTNKGAGLVPAPLQLDRSLAVFGQQAFVDGDLSTKFVHNHLRISNTSQAVEIGIQDGFEFGFLCFNTRTQIIDVGHSVLLVESFGIFDFPRGAQRTCQSGGPQRAGPSRPFTPSPGGRPRFVK